MGFRVISTLLLGLLAIPAGPARGQPAGFPPVATLPNPYANVNAPNPGSTAGVPPLGYPGPAPGATPVTAPTVAYPSTPLAGVGATEPGAAPVALASHEGLQLAQALPPILPDVPLVEEPLMEPVGVVIDTTTPVAVVKIWSGNVELGINGTGGNTETFNMRAGGQLQRQTDFSNLKLNTTYLKNTADGVETANRNYSEGRHEWTTPASRWAPYVHGLLEYDEFRNFGLRLTADAGMAYQFIDNDITNLQARAGFGASKEFDSPDDEVKPEGVFGAEFSHQVSDRQSVDLSVDYYPSVEDVNDFRLNTVLNWVFVIDEANNLSLKLGIIDRYDSTPSGAEYNDIDYSLLLLWAF